MRRRSTPAALRTPPRVFEHHVGGLVRLLAVVCALCTTTTVVSLLGRRRLQRMLPVGIGAVWSGAAMVYVNQTGKARWWCREGCVVLFTAALVLVDWGSAADSSGRAWATAVPLMDFALCVDAERSVVAATLLSVLAWVTVSAVESYLRLGLYDVSVVASDRQLQVCSNPPCALELNQVVLQWLQAVFVLGVDFYATRRFAEGQRQQRSHVQASVDVTQRITSALALFDLAQAEEVLAEAELPAELRDTLATLLSNLASYRPYLPQSCLPENDWSGDSDVTRSPRRPTCTDSTLSPVSGSGTPTAPLPPPRQIAKAPQSATVTLLHTNLHGFLPALARLEESDVAAALNLEIGHFVDNVTHQKGVAGNVSGDHFFASFGAARVCPQRSRAAVNCAWELGEAAASAVLPAMRSTAVCRGRAIAGDFGDADTQRHMILGKVSSRVLVAERLATAWKVRVLADQLAHDDILMHWDCRARRPVVTGSTPRPTHFWEVMQRCAAPGVGGEWMYELASRSPNPWDDFNRAVRLWSDGDRCGSAAVLQELMRREGSDAEVAVCAAAVREHVVSGCDAAVVLQNAADADVMAATFGGRSHQNEPETRASRDSLRSPVPADQPRSTPIQRS